MRKIRVKDITVTLESIEENIRDIAGVRVICSFPSDIYKLADSFLKQDDITPVSYTHLDVYKRQFRYSASAIITSAK